MQAPYTGTITAKLRGVVIQKKKFTNNSELKYYLRKLENTSFDVYVMFTGKFIRERKRKLIVDSLKVE